LAPDRALVEYTEFSRAPLTTEAYEAALGQYARHVLRLGPFTVEAAEQGVIPMTDARFPRRAGASVFRIGTAGGATRPATGYTFAAVRRHSAAVAAALHDGHDDIPAPHGRRALAMDAILLRALDTGRVDGPAFFTGLFRRTPPERLLRFLDGATSLREEWGIGLRTPVGPMLRTALEVPFLPRRHRPAPSAPPAPTGVSHRLPCSTTTTWPVPPTTRGTPPTASPPSALATAQTCCAPHAGCGCRTAGPDCTSSPSAAPPPAPPGPYCAPRRSHASPPSTPPRACCGAPSPSPG